MRGYVRLVEVKSVRVRLGVGGRLSYSKPMTKQGFETVIWHPQALAELAHETPSARLGPARPGSPDILDRGWCWNDEEVRGA